MQQQQIRIPTPLDPNGNGYQPGIVTASIDGAGPFGGYRGDRNALQVCAYMTQWVRVVCDLNTTMTIPVQVLRMTAGGIGETIDVSSSLNFPATSFPLALTEVDTNLYKSGALVKEDSFFVGQGQVFRPLKPCRFQSIDSFATTREEYESWIDHYTPSLHRVVIEQFANNLQFGESGCNIKQGPLDMWPGMSGAYGDDVLSSGSPVAGVYVPYVRAFLTGGRSSAIQLASVVANAREQIIFDDPNGPHILANTDIFVPIRQEIYGYVISRKSGDLAKVLAKLNESDRKNILSVLQ